MDGEGTDNIPEERISAPVSETETDEYGKPFVISSDGSTTFGGIEAESGLKAAPIRLSLGENWKDNNGKNHGYGLLHIEAGHGDQIRAAGFESVQQFVENVAQNYTSIKEGAVIAGKQTYLLEVSDSHNNTLYVQLSSDGKYWNINSAGIFKKKYSRNKPEVHSRPALGSGKDTDTTEVDSGHTMGATAPAGNSSMPSDGKDNALPSDKQGEGAESSVGERIRQAEATVNTEPTEAQKEAGNYRKGHVNVEGFDVTIEQPKGSVRRGKDADGNPWESKMNNTYGYIRGTEGVDGDHIDVFLSDTPEEGNVYVVDQYEPDGTFDEHKVMYGFPDAEAARTAYLSNYEKGWEKTRRIDVTGITKEGFKKWIGSSRRKTKPFAEYKSEAEAERLVMADRVEELADKLNTTVRIITNETELQAVSEDGKPRYSRRERRAKGWWSSRTGEVVVVLSNNVNVADVENTVVHEIVGHKGLRAFIGEERFDEFLGEVYGHASESIRKRIDALTDRMVNNETDRLWARKREAREQAGEDYNSTYWADMAEAEVEAEKKREEYRREATEEYMADLGGRIGDEGFTQMAQDELTLWGKIKAKVQAFLDKFLRGLKIAKSIRLSDKDLSYILYRSWRHAKEGGDPRGASGHGVDVLKEAEDIVRRDRTRFSDGVMNPGWKETARALTETKKPTQKETYSAPKDSRMPHQADAALDSHSESDVAKLVKIADSLKELEKRISSRALGKSEMVYEISQALGVKGASSSKSNYSEIRIPGAGDTTIRVSNHSAEVSNFGKTRNNVGIVIKTSRHKFSKETDIDYVELVYYGDHVEDDQVLQRRIVQGLRRYVETGDFGGMPEPDRLNVSGAYREAIEGLGDRIFFRDGDLGLEEAITKMKAEAAAANGADFKAKQDAMRAIGGNLSKLRQAMARQREYDITTVKSMTDLGKILLDAGLLDDLSKYETKRILSAIKDAVGREDTSKQVERLMDIMVDNQLRMGANYFGKLLSVKGSRIDARGVEVQVNLHP